MKEIDSELPLVKFLVERQKSDISSALFDLDGTLVDSIGVHVDSHFSVLESVGAANHRYEVERLWAECNWNTDTLYRTFGTKLGIDPKTLVAAHVDDMHSRYESHVFTALPGARDLLDMLKQSEVQVAIVTSSSHPLARIALETSELNGYVDMLVSRERTETHKPHAEPYLHALNMLGASACQAVAFEDSWDGLKSALDAGLYTFYLGESSERTQNENSGYEFVASLTELF